MNAHSELVAEVRLALGREPDLVIWVNSGGTAHYGSGHKVRYGLCVGAADLIGIGPGGVFVAWECKTGRGKQTDEQRRFAELVTARSGEARVIRSVDDAWASLRSMRERAGDHPHTSRTTSA